MIIESVVVASSPWGAWLMRVFTNIRYEHQDICTMFPNFIFHTHFVIACMIEHGHVNVKYVHYGLDFYPNDANHIVGSFVKLLCDLEKPPMHSPHAF